MPYQPWLRAVLDFITETTDPYLNFFRRFLPPIGGGGFALDLSPIIGLIVLFVAAGGRRRPDPRVSAPAARAWCLAGALCAARRRRSTRSPRRSIEAHLVLGEQVDVLGPLGLTLSHNRGVAFGLAGGGGRAADRWSPLVGARRRRSTSSPATRPGRGCGSRPGCWPAARSATSIDRVRAGARHRLHRPAALAALQPRRRRDHRRASSCWS